MDNKYFKGLSRNSFLLAWGSLFADISTEMLYPIIPIYLTQILKAGGSAVGIVEGVAEATQYMVQGFSGWVSDKLQKRKTIALIGYFLAALAKPLIGFASVWQQVLGARFLDRFGSGTRSAPRDALIASSVSEGNRGKAFGLEGIGDNLGAFLGPLIAVFLIFSLKVEIRHIFFYAIIPGLIAFLMISLVQENQIIVKSKTKLDISFRQFPKDYWRYLQAVALFGLGNSSNAFLILQTRSIGVTLPATILIYAFYNLVAAFISYPSGFLSDKLGRKNLLLTGFVVFIVAYAGFATTKNIFVVAGLFGLYGLYQGIFRSVGKAFATDFVGQNLRASAVGWYSATIGLSGLFASVVAGQLWDKIGHQAVFIYGATFAVIGSFSLLVMPQADKSTK